MVLGEHILSSAEADRVPAVRSAFSAYLELTLLTSAVDGALVLASFRFWRSGTDDARFLELTAMLYAVGLVCVIALDRVAGGLR